MYIYQLSSACIRHSIRHRSRIFSGPTFTIALSIPFPDPLTLTSKIIHRLYLYHWHNHFMYKFNNFANLRLCVGTPIYSKSAHIYEWWLTQWLNKVKSMHECKIHNVLTKAFINEECRYWATHLYIHVTYIYFILPAVMSYIYCSIVFRQLSDTFVNSTFSADEYNIFTIAIIYTLI